MAEASGFGSTSTETQFIGENKSSAAKITYYLKKRHTLGKMSLEIQDANDKKVTELGPGKSKGINVIEWGYNSKPPKVAKGKTFSFGGFTSPRVPAGTYKVVIVKGKETFTNDLVLEYDNRSTIPLADRKLNEATTMKLFNMTEELAYTVYELDEIVKAAEAVKVKSPSSAKAVAPVITELTKLKETLVVTKGDNYVGAAEPQLREKMTDLYSKVASSFFKPSSAELDNLSAIETRFNTGKADFKKIKDKHLTKLTALITKTGSEPLTIVSLEEFLKQP